MFINIKTLYHTRFSSSERLRKNELWKVLCKDFLNNYITPEDTVVDLGAGQCEFINNINCKRKIAVDLNTSVKNYANSNVKITIGSVTKIRDHFKKNSVDVFFLSNLLEHLDNKEEIFRLLLECYDTLKKGGRLLILQPDIKLVGNSYWDFFDHKVPITKDSLIEALIATNYQINSLTYPFLPYSTKIRYLPKSPLLLKMYLKARPLHFIFGKQFFVCAKK